MTAVIDLGRYCQDNDLLVNNDGVVRVPFFIKGEAVLPPSLSRNEIISFFATAAPYKHYVKSSSFQLLRQPVLKPSGQNDGCSCIYYVMPVFNPNRLIETDIDQLVDTLYGLSTAKILEYTARLGALLAGQRLLTTNLRDVLRLTGGVPDSLLDRWFAGLPVLFDPAQGLAMIDNELSHWKTPGSRFLDGWVEMPVSSLPEGSNTGFDPRAEKATPPRLRAMPTRQLHITAGNSPGVSVVSALRAILTKSAAVIKMPSAGTLVGSVLGLAAVAMASDHPVTRHLSLVYWEGGDEEVEATLFQPGAFDRVVVWGSPAAVTSVQSRALYTRTVVLNPRYGISLIGREAFSGRLEDVAGMAVQDSLIDDQHACNASLLHYLEGDLEQARRYAGIVQQILARRDLTEPRYLPPDVIGRTKRMYRGQHGTDEWYINRGADGEFESGAVISPNGFDLLEHTQNRLIVVRPVDKLSSALSNVHPGVSVAGVYPESRRADLLDRLVARGVSGVFPLGQCQHLFPGMPHDGMMILSELVDWKES